MKNEMFFKTNENGQKEIFVKGVYHCTVSDEKKVKIIFAALENKVTDEIDLKEYQEVEIISDSDSDSEN